MITRISEAPRKICEQAAELILDDTSYSKEIFPHCLDTGTLLAELAGSRQPWSVLFVDRPIAFFRLRSSESKAVIEKFLPTTALPYETIIQTLKNDLEKSRVTSFELYVPEEFIEASMKNGLRRKGALARMSAHVIETQRMPILPLSAPTGKDVPLLAKLMHESYEKNSELKLPDPSLPENLLRDIMGGVLGPYVKDASLMSGTNTNIVSACFVVLNSPQEANVAELFTHPLYRARGLATIEVASAMNKLARLGVRVLTVWIDEANEVARRFFVKLGFKQDRKLAHLSGAIP